MDIVLDSFDNLILFQSYAFIKNHKRRKGIDNIFFPLLYFTDKTDKRSRISKAAPSEVYCRQKVPFLKVLMSSFYTPGLLKLRYSIITTYFYSYKSFTNHFLNRSHEKLDSLGGKMIFFEKSGDRFQVSLDFQQLEPQLFAK